MRTNYGTDYFDYAQNKRRCIEQTLMSSLRIAKCNEMAARKISHLFYCSRFKKMTN